MAQKIVKHVHKLKRLRYTNGEAIYFCILGECEYKINVKVALGKPNQCHRCDKTFNMNEYSSRLAKPHCMDCHKGKGEPVEFTHSLPKEIVKTKSKPLPSDDLLSRLRNALPSVGKADTELPSQITDDDLL